MPDHIDDLLNASIASLRAEITPRIKPGGTAAVRATVKHRHRVRVVAISSLAAVLVLGPAAAYAALGFDRDATPSVNTTPDPTVTPTSAPTPTPTASAPPLPDGRIPAEQLQSATLEIPAWPGVNPATCPGGKRTFVNGSYPKGAQSGQEGTILIGKVIHAQLTDATFFTAALIRCPIGEAERTQVLAFGRDGAGGIVMLGVVVNDHVRDIAAEPSGGIRAELVDRDTCCGAAPEMQQRQWRIYGWNGTRFVQTSGPTKFPPNPYVTDLVVTAIGLDFDPWDGFSIRTATMTVVVRNKGAFASPNQMITLDGRIGEMLVPKLVRAEGAICDGFSQPSQMAYCTHGSLAGGASYTIRLDFKIGFSYETPWQGGASVESTTRLGGGEGGLDDLNKADNSATFTIDAS